MLVKDFLRQQNPSNCPRCNKCMDITEDKNAAYDINYSSICKCTDNAKFIVLYNPNKYPICCIVNDDNLNFQYHYKNNSAMKIWSSDQDDLSVDYNYINCNLKDLYKETMKLLLTFA